MPFYVFNFKEAFRREVMDRFVQAYERGETPNPCVDCNRYIKFEKLMRRGEEVGFPYIATGHYARVEFDGAAGRWLLKKGLDENKDQSYMLWSLTQWELSRLLLPLGGLTKERVRQLAEDIGVNTMTVNKAYALLKSEGYIEIDRRKGAAVRRAAKPGELDEDFRRRLTLLAAEAAAGGVSPERFLDACREAASAMNPKGAE